MIVYTLIFKLLNHAEQSHYEVEMGKLEFRCGI